MKTVTGLTDCDRFNGFRIPDALIELHQIRRVTDYEARNDCGIHAVKDGDLSGMVYPVFGRDHLIKAYRIRRDNPEIEDGKPKNKWVYSTDPLHVFFEQSTAPLVSDSSI